MRQSIKGFTIVEILIAIVLLTIIIMIVLGSLNGLFGLNRKSSQQSTLTNQAQVALEEVRGQWQDSVAYGAACVKVPVAGKAPNGATISVSDENANGAAYSSLTYEPIYATDCTTAVAPGGAMLPASPLRRVTVTVKTAAGVTPAQESTLVMEIAKP